VSQKTETLYLSKILTDFKTSLAHSQPQNCNNLIIDVNVKCDDADDTDGDDDAVVVRALVDTGAQVPVLKT